MVKFAHIADCHLGGWRQEELQELNFKSFEKIIEISIQEKVDFILIAGDLFDSAYPPIEILKESFSVFKKIHDNKIPVYLIAGSHDFSASGKTFLDVLEKAGFCKNVENWSLDNDGKIILKPTMHDKIAIYGYPGRKSGMEVEDLKKVLFEKMDPQTIFMIHTTIKDVVGTIHMDSIEKEKLPLANYYAMGHIHQRFEDQIFDSRYVYPGPTFPMNFQELSDLKHGSFRIVEMSGTTTKAKSIEVPLKDVVNIKIEIDNALTATQKIISEMDKLNLKDKIVLLKIVGTLSQGKTGDINFQEIEDFIKRKEAYSFLRNISSIKNIESNDFYEKDDSDEVDKLENRIIEDYALKNPAEFNKFLPSLMSSLSIEKNEDEKSSIFEERLLSELIKILNLNDTIK